MAIHVKGLTIDGPTTRDIDDAIWIEKMDGGYRVFVSIADVSAKVPIGSEADERALEMTETIYRASGNSPMLPHSLGEELLSLWPGTPKDTLTVELEVVEGAVQKCQLYPSLLTSIAKLEYAEIPGIIKEARHPLHQPIELALNLAMGLLKSRRSHGALALYDLNTGWVTTEEGYLKQIEDHVDTVGYIIIQELMILANAAVAEFVVKHDLPVLFRNHLARAAAPDRSELMMAIQNAMVTPPRGSEHASPTDPPVAGPGELRIHPVGALRAQPPSLPPLHLPDSTLRRPGCPSADQSFVARREAPLREIRHRSNRRTHQRTAGAGAGGHSCTDEEASRQASGEADGERATYR